MSKIYWETQKLRDSIREGKTVTLVGGSFDLLHAGHVHLLEYAKKLGDVLVVCVLSDTNVASYKGSRRPIVKEKHRAIVVGALGCVNRVFISDIDTSHPDVLSSIKPDNVIFGIEDTERWRITMRNREALLKAQFPDISCHYLERFVDGSVSTSDIIQQVLNSYSND